MGATAAHLGGAAGEASTRLIASLNGAADAARAAGAASEKYARSLVWATWALFTATAVLVLVPALPLVYGRACNTLIPMSPNPHDNADAAEHAGATLTRAKLANILLEKIGLNRREARDFVEQFFEEMSSALERGETVKLSGFGNFQLRNKAERPGRNPKTREEIPVKARRVVTFHASRGLKARIEQRLRGR